MGDVYIFRTLFIEGRRISHVTPTSVDKGKDDEDQTTHSITVELMKFKYSVMD